MRQRVGVVLVVLLILSLLIFTRNQFPPVSLLQGTLQKLTVIPQRTLYGLKVAILKVGQERDVEKLKEENRKLLARMTDYEKLKQDNVALRSQFESSFSREFRLLPAYVIGFSGRYTAPHTLVIDKGREDGVSEGMAVVWERTLVGEVHKVSPVFSSILLPTHKSFSTVAKTVQRAASGILTGEEDFILMDRVLITDELEREDIVVTKGEIKETGVGLPPDIIVGKVNSVNKRETKPFQTAKVAPLLDYSKLSTVFVVKGVR